MAERKPLRKSVRFAIFERDAFTCAYCGRRPPAVVLEIDHIVPVAEGGSNEDTNLITSCEDCNAGKGRRVLASPQPKPDVDRDYLAAQQELAELERYNRLKIGRDKALAQTTVNLQETWIESWQSLGWKKPWFPVKAELLHLLVTFRPEDIEWAFNYATGRINKPKAAFKYACGCLWRRAKEEGADGA